MSGVPTRATMLLEIVANLLASAFMITLFFTYKGVSPGASIFIIDLVVFESGFYQPVAFCQSFRLCKPFFRCTLRSFIC